jgi:hypothetical protein
LFTPQEIRTQLERIEREQNEYHADTEQDDELDAEEELDKEDKLILENPAATAERARRFASIKELLTATELGTS